MESPEKGVQFRCHSLGSSFFLSVTSDGQRLFCPVHITFSLYSVKLQWLDSCVATRCGTATSEESSWSPAWGSAQYIKCHRFTNGEVLLLLCHGDKKSWIYFTRTRAHRHRHRHTQTHTQMLFSKEVLEETAVGLSGVPYSRTERWVDVFSTSEDVCSPFWILLNLPVL